MSRSDPRDIEIARLRDENGRLIEVAAIAGYFIAAIEGQELSDFALSFAPVRTVVDLRAEHDRRHGPSAKSMRPIAFRDKPRDFTAGDPNGWWDD